MSRVSKNIENIQKLVTMSVNDLLVNEGYLLVKKESFGDSQALLLQWVNKDRQHTFQLNWDIRDTWFSLGEFNRTNNLNYIESTEIGLFPYSKAFGFFRERHNVKYVEKIKSKIKSKIKERLSGFSL